MLVNQSTLFDGEYRHLHGLSTLTPSQYGGELSELDDAGPHFDNVQAYQSQSVVCFLFLFFVYFYNFLFLLESFFGIDFFLCVLGSFANENNRELYLYVYKK